MTRNDATTRDAATTRASDAKLAGWIALLMRVGTVVAAILLSIGAALLPLPAGAAATVLLTAGCGLLVLLPIIRLMLMAVHFGRHDRHLLPVSMLVLALVAAGVAAGLVA